MWFLSHWLLGTTNKVIPFLFCRNFDLDHAPKDAHGFDDLDKVFPASDGILYFYF